MRCVFMAVLALVARLPAQQPADRAAIDSMVAESRRVVDPGGSTLDVRCANRSADVTRLCQGMFVERRGELSGDRDDAIRASDILTRTVEDQPKWAVAWYGLGLARLQLARDTVFSKGGPLLPIGASNELGAANALIHALELDNGFALAANALATAAMPRESRDALKDRVAMLRRVRRLLSPGSLAAAAFLERATGHSDSALALERRALASGQVDSGLVLLPMARDLYRLGRTAEGRAALLQGAGVPTEAAHQAYHGEIAWVASPQELAQWDSLPATQRSNWLADFWQKRDIAEGRADGERLAEHYRRIEYAVAHFPITLPQTGRQRSLSYTTDMVYYLEQEAAKCAMRNPDVYPDLAQISMLSRTIGSDDPHRYYHPIQDQIDDRGVVWIRHGKPTKTASDVSGRAVEIWRYERPEGPLVLQFIQADFQGSVGATVLVPTLLTLSLGVRNRVCYLDASLCGRASNRMESAMTQVTTGRDPRAPAGTTKAGCSGTVTDSFVHALDAEIKAEGTALAPEEIIHSRDRGRAEIDTAVTTDTYHREFTHALRPGVQIYGLEHAGGGESRIVVAFAIPGEQLTATKAVASGHMVYPVRIQVMAARTSDGVRIDLDTLRQLGAPAPLKKGEFIAGVVELPLPPGAYHVSTVFTQADGRGAIAHLSEVVVPGGTTALAVSDLVLGQAGSGVHWSSGATEVPLNPLNTYPAAGSAEVYFQLSGLQPGQPYTTRIDVFRSNDDSTRAARLTISSTQAATQSRIEVSRSLVLSNLDAGTYRVRLTVSAAGKSVKSEGWVTIVR
jgi:hypothetical protein